MPSLVPHPRFEALERFLREHSRRLARAWSGSVFRCVDLAYARPKLLLDGKGTLRWGGRWMPPGVAPAVHAASTDLGAVKETRNRFSHYGLERPRQRPRLLVEIALQLQALLDLTVLDGGAGAGVSAEELAAEDWRKLNQAGEESLSQAAGRAAWGLGFEGVLALSARDRRGRTLVLFPGNLRAGSSALISGESELNAWLEG